MLYSDVEFQTLSFSSFEHKTVSELQTVDGHRRAECLSRLQLQRGHLQDVIDVLSGRHEETSLSEYLTETIDGHAVDKHVQRRHGE